MKLSLVIPCYNEAPSLPRLTARCLELVDVVNAEVILVDNGSTDDTQAKLSRLLAGQTRVRAARVDVNQGYGYGILAGLRAAQGDVLGWTHADLQCDPLDAAVGFRLFAESSDPLKLFVKGRRYGRPAADALFTLGMSAFETLLLGVGLHDINAQPTMFARSFFEEWRSAPYDFSLDLYAYSLAKRSGLTVARFPVRFEARAHGVSHWNVDWRAKRKFIQRTMSYSFELRRVMSRQEDDICR
jgi:polyisoprenyl-phosphate glycosyltransferase